MHPVANGRGNVAQTSNPGPVVLGASHHPFVWAPDGQDDIPQLPHAPCVCHVRSRATAAG